MLQIIKNTNFNFIGIRRIAFIISAILLINGFYGLYLINAGKANMGLDFTGGSTVHVKFAKEITVGQIRTIMAENNFSKVTIQQVGKETDNEYLIRLGVHEVETGDASARVTGILKKDSGDDKIEVMGSSEIGPVVSMQLKQKAMLAVFWAVIGILVYIWFRFRFKFAVAATFATFHDVIVVLGIMVLMGREIDLLVITALLTLAGYSLTDTVVLFDRIRENLRKILKMTYEKIVNDSINEVLSRTIVTSGTTLLVVASLFLFGGHALNNFSLALLLGILVGTYSSIFVASPLVVEWENFEKKNKHK